VTKEEAASLSTGEFRRYQMVYLSYAALFGVDQEAGKLLMDRLVDAGAVEPAALSKGLERTVGGTIQ